MNAPKLTRLEAEASMFEARNGDAADGASASAKTVHPPREAIAWRQLRLERLEKGMPAGQGTVVRSREENDPAEAGAAARVRERIEEAALQARENGHSAGEEPANPFDQIAFEEARAAIRPAPSVDGEISEAGAEEEIGTGHNLLAGVKHATDLSNCLVPLLEAMHWQGDPRHVAEALPHFLDEIDVTAFRNAMATLQFESRPFETRLDVIDPRLFPCLFLPRDGEAMVLLEWGSETHRVFDGGLCKEVDVERRRTRGLAYVFRPSNREAERAAIQRYGWFRSVAERFRGVGYQILLVSLIINLLALATPLFVKAVYDQVIATGSVPTLWYFAAGVGIAIAADWVLRTVRARILSVVGARLGSIVGNGIFHRILYLPPTFTERASIGSQVARLKDFETIREFFTGPLALILIELPFTLIFVAVIAILGGPVALVPIVMVTLFALLGVVVGPLLRAQVASATRATSKKQELVIETLKNIRAIKYAGAETVWHERFRELSAQASLANFRTAQLSSLVQAMSHVLMIGSGIATVVFGVFRVLSGDMTIGALVASMILVWRVLAPLQTAFLSLARANQVRASISQVNSLMQLKPEREANALVQPLRRFGGSVDFDRVSIRYSPDADPALVGVSFRIEPGEVVAVIGGNGSGKSTVLKLLAGIYTPQAGNIRIDGTDIRQIDPVELRHALAYVPQNRQFFYGTIAQNLRLAEPTATDAELRWACKMAGVLENIEALEQGSGKWRQTGFDVRIGDLAAEQMPSGLMQRLNLARGFLKRAPLMLFDEPGSGLNVEGDKALSAAIEEFRGDSTIFLVTHRPSHIKLADKVIWLDRGAMRAFGPTEQILQSLPEGQI